MYVQKLRLEEYKKRNPNELTGEQFKRIEEEMKNPKEGMISDEYFDFKLWDLGFCSRQEYFAKYVATRLVRNNAKKVLEVGCGRTCRLSKLLEKRGFEMTCIDPKVDFSEKSNHIVVKNQKFDYTYDLSDYDYVIAQEPCDATEHIVKACVEQKKPFIISLCRSPHTLICGKQMKDVSDWHQYLRNISGNETKLICIKATPLLKTYILLKY